MLKILLTSLLAISWAHAQESTLELTFAERHELPGVSIRAIQVTDSTEIWFAGSHGRIGRINNGEMLLDSIGIQMDSTGMPPDSSEKLPDSEENKLKYPGFRAIAYNGEHVFVLSIENPALLYRLVPQEPVFRAELVYREEHPKAFYDAMTFIDSQNGIAMGDPTDGCLSVILTQDGGQSWKKVPCENIPAVSEGEAAFAASNSNLAVAENKVWMVSGGKKARVWTSTDLGRTWKVAPSPIQQGKTMTGIFSLAFYDQYQGLIMGGNWEDKKDTHQTKARSLDGGESWNLIADGMEPGYISCVQYVPGSKGKELMAVSTEGIFYSDSAGDRWSKISGEGFYSLRFYDAETAWLSGNEKIAKVKIRRKQ